VLKRLFLHSGITKSPIWFSHWEPAPSDRRSMRIGKRRPVKPVTRVDSGQLRYATVQAIRRSACITWHGRFPSSRSTRSASGALAPGKPRAWSETRDEIPACAFYVLHRGRHASFFAQA